MKLRMHRALKLLLILPLAACFEACTPLYRASFPFQPEMYERNDAQIRVGAETGSAFVNAAYSPLKHVYVLAGGHGWAGEFSNYAYGEAGIGFYGTENEKSGYSISFTGGYGESAVYTEMWTSGMAWSSSHISAEMMRFAIQPGFYTALGKYASFATTFKGSFVQWLSYEVPDLDLFELEIDPDLDFYIEPAMNFRVGSEHVKFIFGAGLQLPIHRSFPHYNTPFHFAFGVDVCLAKRFSAATRKN